MQYIIAGLILLSQIIVLPTFTYRWCKEYSAQIFILLVLACEVWKNNKWISSFLLWSVLSFIIFRSLVINDSVSPSTYDLNIYSMFTLMNIVAYSILYVILRRCNLNIDIIYKSICLVAIIQSSYVILQYLQLDQFFYNRSLAQGGDVKIVRWPVGTWGNEALVSWCIALCSPFFLRYRALRFKLGYALCFIAVLCTKVSAGILGMVLGLLFWSFFKCRKLFYAIGVSVLIIASVAVYTGKSSYYLQDTHRMGVWKKSIELWKPRAITGYGMGSFKAVFWMNAPEFRSHGHWGQAHNEFLQILFEWGIIGFGIFIGLMLTTALKAYRIRRGLVPFTALVVFIPIAFLGFPLHTAIGVIPFLALVLFERSCDGEEN